MSFARCLRFVLFPSLLALACGGALAASPDDFGDRMSQPEGGWHTQDGKPVPDTDSMKSLKGFGGAILVTPDADWKEKWNTPAENRPSFRHASSVEYGEHVTILTFYSNPQPDKDGTVHVLCDIKLTRPDGSVPVDTKGTECAPNKLQGSRFNTRLTYAVIEFIGEDGDPPGVWRVEVSLTDKNRNVTLPLKAEFTLKPKAAGKAAAAKR